MAEVEEYRPVEEVLPAITSLVLAIVVFFVFLLHFHKLWQDLCTSDRKCLNHRKEKPRITPFYKLKHYTTMVCIFAYFWVLLFTAIQYNFLTGGCSLALSVLEKIGFFCSSASLYLVYIIRLRDVYGDSGYGYKVNTLWTVAVLIVVFAVALFLFTTITISMYPLYIDDTDKAFPFFCQIISQPPWVFIAGSGILVFDLILSISSMVAFVVPLKKVIGAYGDPNEENDASRKLKLQKVLYIGFKYKVLVFAASVTTLLWILLLFFQLTALATLLINLDYLISPVVVMLMTGYYPAHICYERLCCICVTCCDPTKQSYRSALQESARNAGSGGDVTVALSINTQDAFNYINVADDGAQSAQPAEENPAQN